MNNDNQTKINLSPSQYRAIKMVLEEKKGKIKATMEDGIIDLDAPIHKSTFKSLVRLGLLIFYRQKTYRVDKKALRENTTFFSSSVPEQKPTEVPASKQEPLQDFKKVVESGKLDDILDAFEALPKVLQAEVARFLKPNRTAAEIQDPSPVLVRDLPIGNRAINALHAIDVRDLEGLREFAMNEFLFVLPGIGKGTSDKVLSYLRERFPEDSFRPEKFTLAELQDDELKTGFMFQVVDYVNDKYKSLGYGVIVSKHEGALEIYTSLSLEETDRNFFFLSTKTFKSKFLKKPSESGFFFAPVGEELKEFPSYDEIAKLSPSKVLKTKTSIAGVFGYLLETFQEESEDEIHHACPHCGLAASGHHEVSELFGFREMGDGTIRHQSWCRICRNVS